VDSIAERLGNDKIRLKAETILQQARTLTEPNITGTDIEIEKLTSEQYAEKAGDYKTAVKKLKDEAKVKIYTGRTGLLSAPQMQTDRYLGKLAIKGSYYPVNLTQVVFAVDGLEASELGRFDVPKPRLYENIGPAISAKFFNDRFPIRDVSGQIIVLVRVIEAHKASEPNSVDVEFGTHSLVFDPNEDKTKDHRFSLRETITEDLKKLAAL